MTKFGGFRTFDGDGAYQQLIAQVQDIKASPYHGQKRLVVKERGTLFQQTVIDIEMSAARGLEEKESYVFNVTERAEDRCGYQRHRSSGFKAYHCGDAPEEFTASMDSEMKFNRFGGSGFLKDSKRTIF